MGQTNSLPLPIKGSRNWFLEIINQIWSFVYNSTQNAILFTASDLEVASKFVGFIFHISCVLPAI